MALPRNRRRNSLYDITRLLVLRRYPGASNRQGQTRCGPPADQVLVRLPSEDFLSFLLSQQRKDKLRISCLPRLCLRLVQGQPDEMLIHSKSLDEFGLNPILDLLDLAQDSFACRETKITDCLFPIVFVASFDTHIIAFLVVVC